MKPIPFFLSLLVGLASGPVARSQTLTLTPQGLQSEDHYVTVGSDPADSATGYASAQLFSVSDVSPVSLNLSGTLTLFCVEVGQDAPASAQTYTVLPAAQADSNGSSSSLDAASGVPSTGLGAATAANLEKLYGYVFPSGSYAGALNLDLASAGITGDAAYDGAVFQLAVWQVAETGGFANIATTDAGSGFFAFVPSETPTPSDQATLVADADKLLAAVAGDAEVSPLNLDVLHSDAYQDYLLPDPNGSLVQISEPSNWAEGAVALSFVCWCRLRRRGLNFRFGV